MDAILGRPFAWLERGPQAFYCMGLWLYLLEKVTGIRIEDPWDGHPSLEVLRGFWRRFLPLDPAEDPRPLDLIFWRWGPGQPHVVTVENARWAVTVEREIGVQRQPLHEARARGEKIFRLRELW